MCSIFGIGFFKDNKFRKESSLTGVISRLFREAEVGGRRASGLSIMREKKNFVLRRPCSGSDLVKTEEYLDFMEDSLEDIDKDNNRLMSIIGHCRWPTQGPASNNLNNHPQVIDHIIGVHNGVISNDHELFKTFSKMFTRKAQVDTEIIFQLINYFNVNPKRNTVDSIQMAANYLGGSFACAMQNTWHPYNLYLFRYHNPIKILYYSKLGLIFFATREHFIVKAFEEFIDGAEGKGEPIDLLDSQGMALNLWNKTFAKFHLKRRDKESVTNVR